MTECPICKKNNFKQDNLKFLEVDKNIPLSVDYFICDCSFMYYRFKNISKNYSINNKYINRNTGSGADISFDIKRLEKSFSNISDYLSRCNSLIDVGCNNGTFLKLVKENNENILLYGSDVEICDETIKDLNDIGIKIKQTTDISDFNIQFDFISINHVLEHVEDIDDFFDKLKRVLNANGKIYIEVPDSSRYLDYYFQPFSYFDLEHINHFNIQNIEHLVNLKGFNVVEKFELDIDMSHNIKYPGIGIIIEFNQKIKPVLNQKESFYKTKLLEYINKSKNEINKYDYQESFDNKVLFGVGANTLRTIGLLKKDIQKVKYFVDNNEIFHERSVNGISIKSSTFLINDSDCPEVIIFSKLYFDEIKKDLLNRGFNGKINSFF